MSPSSWTSAARSAWERRHAASHGAGVDAERAGQSSALNLGDVDYIDSSGIGELVNAYTKVRDAGGG